MQNESSSVLTIEDQKKITLTSVESVDAFSPTEISLTVQGKKMKISGSGLKVVAFSKTGGTFSATGLVSAVRYGGAKGKFFQRLFR